MWHSSVQKHTVVWVEASACLVRINLWEKKIKVFLREAKHEVYTALRKSMKVHAVIQHSSAKMQWVMRPMTSELQVQSDQCWSKGTTTCNTRWWGSALFLADEAMTYYYSYSSVSAIEDWTKLQNQLWSKPSRSNQESLTRVYHRLLCSLFSSLPTFKENCGRSLPCFA